MPEARNIKINLEKTMATQNDSGFTTFTAAKVLAAFRRVKLSSTTNRTVTYADAGEKAIGVTQDAAAATGDKINVKLFTTPGTFKVTAKTAMATRNGAVYGASDGYVDDAASGGIIGYNLDTASAVGAIIEMAPIADLPLTEADAVATIDDDSGGTSSGTEQFGAIAALTCLAAIDDDTGGTNSGTEQLAAVAALTSLAAIDDDSAGTGGGTEQLSHIHAVGGTAAAATHIRNNFHVLADEHNKLRVDVNAIRTKLMNGLSTLADEHNKVRVDLVAIRTKVMNGQAVTADEINAIIVSLQGAGFMGT